ncbi:MAG: NUDIX domain-containing protein [Pseudomonadales bacterium]
MLFRFCPGCGNPQSETAFNEEAQKFQCPDCEFVLYRNTAATSSMILRCGEEFLFSVRANEPSRGLLDFPGGFVDPGESIEEAFVREMDEEIGWCPEDFQYAFSSPNIYLYQGLAYHTSDVFYYAEVSEKPDVKAADDVADLRWIQLSDIKDEELAFASMRHAIEQLREIFGVS